MALVCIICHDNLSVINRTEVNELRPVAVECGHVFHNSCLRQWVEQGNPNSNQCPCCRGNVTLSTVLSLYPTYTNDTSSVDTETNGDNNVELHNTLSELKKENQSHLKKIEDLIYQLQLAEDVNKRLKSTCQIWTKLTEDLNAYKVQYSNLRAKCERLEITLKHLKSNGLTSKCDMSHHTTESINECCKIV